VATKTQLRSRWLDGNGRRVLDAVVGAVRRRVDVDELRGIVSGLPYADEVAPAPDLRGIEFPPGVMLFRLDWPKVRLDYASLGGNVSESKLAGAVLDHVEAINLSFHGDFTRASFVRAVLRGADFQQAVLGGADFSQAKLMGAYFQDAKCSGAIFTRADLRLTTFFDADLTGADYSGADLRDATLLRARTEGATFEGANLEGATTPDGGRSGLESGGTYELAEFDATRAVLEQRNEGGRYDRVLERMSELRPKLEADPSSDWGSQLAAELPKDVMDEVADALAEGGSNLSSFP